MRADEECKRLGILPEVEQMAFTLLQILTRDEKLSVHDLERQLRTAVCLQALERSGGVKIRALKELKINRTTFIERLRWTGLVPPKAGLLVVPRRSALDAEKQE